MPAELCMQGRRGRRGLRVCVVRVCFSGSHSSSCFSFFFVVQKLQTEMTQYVMFKLLLLTGIIAGMTECSRKAQTVHKLKL